MKPRAIESRRQHHRRGREHKLASRLRRLRKSGSLNVKCCDSVDVLQIWGRLFIRNAAAAPDLGVLTLCCHLPTQMAFNTWMQRSRGKLIYQSSVDTKTLELKMCLQSSSAITSSISLVKSLQQAFKQSFLQIYIWSHNDSSPPTHIQNVFFYTQMSVTHTIQH